MQTNDNGKITMMTVKLMLVFSLILFSGCNTNEVTDDGKAVITDFYIVGSNNNDRDTTPIVDPYDDSGRFLVFIGTIKPSLGYTLSLAVSSTISGNNSVSMFDIECDDDDPTCYDSEYLALSCTYLPDLTGQCSRGESYDLNDHINTIPYSGFLIAKLCHRVEKTCTTSIQRVVLL